MLYDKVGKVFRNITTKDQFNRPKQTLSEIGVYPCTISESNKTSDGVKDGTPNDTINVVKKLYGVSFMDIKEGDLIEIDSIKYSVGKVSKPRNHHIEAFIILERDV